MEHRSHLDRIRDLASEIRADERALRNARAKYRRAIIRAWHSGCSQQQIADAARISRQRVSKIIDGKKA